MYPLDKTHNFFVKVLVNTFKYLIVFNTIAITLMMCTDLFIKRHKPIVYVAENILNGGNINVL